MRIAGREQRGPTGSARRQLAAGEVAAMLWQANDGSRHLRPPPAVHAIVLAP